jgi:hypothetical protein
MSRDAKERSKYEGLKKKMSSPAFIADLGLMNDALLELKDLSEAFAKK